MSPRGGGANATFAELETAISDGAGIFDAITDAMDMTAA
jgi:hypothetical protein